MKVVFMGTPDFAVPTLEKIIAAGHEVIGVVHSRIKRREEAKKLCFLRLKKKLWNII